MAATYLDSSALVKLVVREEGSGALRSYLRRRRPWISSALARVEVRRAVLPAGPAAATAADDVLARCELVRINARVLDLAADLTPVDLRSLDAIHLATAERLREDIGALVTYDARMADAARDLGHRVVEPH